MFCADYISVPKFFSFNFLKKCSQPIRIAESFDQQYL